MNKIKLLFAVAAMAAVSFVPAFSQSREQSGDGMSKFRCVINMQTVDGAGGHP